MKTREEILSVLTKHRGELETRFKATRLGLFGSYARGEQRADGDVHILVDVDQSIGLEFVTLADRIETLLGIPVEVVSRRAIKPRHLKVIEKELIYV